MATIVWYVWMTTSSAVHAETLCAKLIRRGYIVGPLGRQLIVQYDDCPSCVIAMSVQRSPRNDDEKKEYTAGGIYAEVCDVMKQVKGKYWSLVVSEAAACTWNIGNERISSDDKERAAEAKKLN